MSAGSVPSGIVRMPRWSRSVSPPSTKLGEGRLRDARRQRLRPRLRIVEADATLETVKRLGSVLDERARRTAVPVAL